MSPLPYGNLLPSSQNSTFAAPFPLVALSDPSFSALVQVVLSFVGVCIVHALTSHSPIPPPHPFGHLASIVLGPVGAGIPSSHWIVLFAAKMTRGNWSPIRRRTTLHNAISAGAIAIRVPKRFVKLVDIDPLGWRALAENAPVCELGVDYLMVWRLNPTRSFTACLHCRALPLARRRHVCTPHPINSAPH